MSFFSVPLSGLNASQSALQAVSNNLANTDTDGYKDQNVTFADVFAQSGITNGAGDPFQTGQGVLTASTTSDFTGGTVSATGIASNMALNGNGFFVMQQANGTIAYSRAGDFTQNKLGQLVAPDGSLVMGYPAANGVINTAAPLQPLVVGTGLTSAATASTAFNATINLDATTATNAQASASPISVYDSLGGQQNLQISYTKTGPNSWSYAVTIPSSSLASPTSPTGEQTLTTGTLNFDQNGKLTSVNGASPAPIAITVPQLADGAAGMNLNWDLADPSGNSLITQTDLASSTTSATANGNAGGVLSNFSIGSDGTIEGLFANGTTTALGQVAVATVANDQGLQQIGGNLFQATAGSGVAQIGFAGTGGRGTITGGSVEGSNVDVASEFSKMIVAQQAYQANAKVVTTFDQVSQATLAMIQQ